MILEKGMPLSDIVGLEPEVSGPGAVVPALLATGEYKNVTQTAAPAAPAPSAPKEDFMASFKAPMPGGMG